MALSSNGQDKWFSTIKPGFNSPLGYHISIAADAPEVLRRRLGVISVAVATADVSRSIIRNKRFVVSTITFDNSYPTGGEPLAPSALGLASVDFLSVSSTNANTFAWDRANNKIKAFVRTTGAEVANATDLSTVVVDVFAIGS